MPRYESGSGDKRRFWEIAVIDSEVRTRHGRVGTDGRVSEPRMFGDPDEARKEAEKRIAEKVKKGFELVDDDASGQAYDHALVDAILERPEDDEPYLVYGDWLQSQGDSRGELVMVHHRLAQDPDNPDLQAQAAALEARLMPARLAKMLRKKRSPDKAASGFCEVVWRLGFIHAARIGRSSDRPPYTVRELVAALLVHPSAQVLHSLTIGALGPEVDEYDYSAVVEEICLAAPVPLRELFIADFAPEHSELGVSKLGDVSGLYHALPGLETLHLRGGAMMLGDMDLPRLRALAITTSAFETGMLEAVARASWPRLEALDLSASGSALPAAGLAALVTARGFPALRRLGLREIDDTGDVLRDSLMGSEPWPRLEVLDLSGGSLTDRDAESMLGQPHAFGHLRELDVRANQLSEQAALALRGLCGRVLVADQKPPSVARLNVTEQQILEFAPDTRSMTAARKLVKPGAWPELGSEGRLLWGRCQGRELYHVYVDMEAMQSGCTCPSMKYPCKHAIALLMMAHGHDIPLLPPPEGFVEACQAGGAGRIWD